MFYLFTNAETASTKKGRTNEKKWHRQCLRSHITSVYTLQHIGYMTQLSSDFKYQHTNDISMFQLSHSKALQYLSSYNDPSNYAAVRYHEQCTKPKP